MSLPFLNIFITAQTQHQSTFLPEMQKMPHSMIRNWECHITKMTYYYKQCSIHTKLQPILLHVFSQCYWVALHLRCSI